MKYILVTFVCLFFSGIASAQKDSLSLDENNKYIYYQLVTQPASNTDTLYNRALYFLTTAYPKKTLKLVKENKLQGTLLATGVFGVSKRSLLTNHQDGEIKYTFKIEVKDSKYRFWLTDFVYTPYRLNRYNSFEPVPGIEIPMEQASGKLDNSDVKGYLDQVLARSVKMGKQLKAYMLNVSSLAPKNDVKKINKISTKDW